MLIAAYEAFNARDVESVLAEVMDYGGTSVADLLAFMQRNDLQFGPAKTRSEREPSGSIVRIVAGGSLRTPLMMVAGAGTTA